MCPRLPHLLLLLCPLAVASFGERCVAAPPADAPVERPVDFQHDIRPLLARHCYRCHGPDAAKRQADLRLDSHASATADLGGRRAIDLANPPASELLVRLTTGDEALRMPPPNAGPPLAAAEIERLQRWIAQGAPYAPHWLYAPLVRPQVPSITGLSETDSRGTGSSGTDSRGTGVGHPIDAFLEERATQAGLTAGPVAEPRVLIRRVAQDLCGLPPAAVGLSADVPLPDDAAWNLLVERLLAHPAFGERFATWWLDLVRYADTVGYHGDQEHPISPYRDYVIEAFNSNLPFDQFTREQLAGDLLPEPTRRQIIATGYNRVLQTSHEGGVQQAEYQKKYDADRVRNLGQVWLGMTTGCAECHDHKYDQITQRDFYSLAAYFADVDDTLTFQGGDSNPTRREPEIEVFEETDLPRVEALNQELAAWKANGENPAEAERMKSLQAELNSIRQRSRRTMITRRREPRVIRVLSRGDWQDETGPVVEARPPAFLAGDQAPGPGSRLDLAHWLCHDAAGQTARVFVNRVWALLFGEGLSRSLDDGGVQGDLPSHPELLDWLSAEFIDSGWDVKHLLRCIVTSRAYRQTSRASEEQQARDPENRLFTHQNSWRLSAEAIRDQALAVSGLLVSQQRGRPARPWQPAGYYVQLNFPKREYQPDTNPQQYRRAVYMHWQRQYLHPMLVAFDAPTREECTARRNVSNTPQAALVLLNDPTFLETARALAARVMRSPVPNSAPNTDPDRVAILWHNWLDRSPSPTEQAESLAYLAEARRDFAEEATARAFLSPGQYQPSLPLDTSEWAAWTALARVVQNLGEGLIRE
jgi:cytochrome c553